jgi:hypothetical protein
VDDSTIWFESVHLDISGCSLEINGPGQGMALDDAGLVDPSSDTTR